MTLTLTKNINNLNHFWQALNASENEGLFSHNTWPNKHWRADFGLPSDISNLRVPAGKTYSTITEQNLQGLSGCAVKSQLVIMNLSLPQAENSQTATERKHPKIIKLTRDDSATTWATACGLAFGYTIDATVIQGLLNNPNASVFAYLVDGQIAGTAISYQSGDTLGIHQVGTVPNYRKMGIAAALMEHLIDQAKYNDISYVSLQASKAGLHLYEKMGFKALAKLTSIVALD